MSEPTRDGPTDEETGVKLPFMRLTSTMIVVIITGVVPVAILSFVYVSLLGVLPAGHVTRVFVLLVTPLVAWGLYYLYIACTAAITKVFLRYYDARSPGEPGVLQRQFKDTTHPDYVKLHYYHMRGAVVKYSLWITQKCPFPSLVNRLLRYYGHNTIGKGVIYENCFPGLEMTVVGDGVVIEAGASLSTHVVESLYGNLVLDQVTIGDNAVVGVSSIVGPGIVVPPGHLIGDNCMTFKNWPLTPVDDPATTFYNGSPARKASFLDMFADGELRRSYLGAIPASAGSAGGGTPPR